MYPRLFQFGSLVIPTNGVLLALGLVSGLFVARMAARRLSLDPDKVWNLAVLGILTTLFGSKLLMVFGNWADFKAHPMWMLGLVTVRSGWVFAGGVAFALAVCLFYALAVGLPLLRTLDALAPAIALGHALACVGSFAAGSGYGSPTNAAWGVVYTSRWAAQFSGTPLGVRVHPVQLYEAAAEGIGFLLLIWLLRRHEDRSGGGDADGGSAGEGKVRDGEMMGAWLFLFGLALFFLEYLRGNGLDSVAAGGLSANQFLAMGIVVVGALLWLHRDSLPSSPSETSSEQTT